MPLKIAKTAAVVTFICARCTQEKTSKTQVTDTDSKLVICTGCYGNLKSQGLKSFSELSPKPTKPTKNLSTSISGPGFFASKKRGAAAIDSAPPSEGMAESVAELTSARGKAPEAQVKKRLIASALTSEGVAESVAELR
jgi:hypothetical protein